MQLAIELPDAGAGADLHVLEGGGGGVWVASHSFWEHASLILQYQPLPSPPPSS